MSSINEVLSRLEAGVEELRTRQWDGLCAGERLAALERLETVRRKVTACSYDLGLAVQRCSTEELGGRAATVIADVLRISPRESTRRLREAAAVSARSTLIGHTLPAALPATAKAWHAGLLDLAHLHTIDKFVGDLPEHLPPGEVEKAEAFLAHNATELRPDQLDKLADRLAVTLNPDGTFSDEHRARHRGFTWTGRQRPDGMSTGKLVASPELRAMIDALFAKLAAPGMCNPADQTPTCTADPTQDVIDRDARSHPQRQHDALAALCRNFLGDPKLGQHRGLPVTVIVTTTLDQLQSATGHAVTAGGTLIPMSDVIRLASHAHHYLAVFDSHTQQPLYLGRTKRIASPDQRIVLHATDRGCTAPGCAAPGYLCEVHHVEEWADGGHTNIDTLTFACGQHHKLLKPGSWRTRKRQDGTTEWLPPPGLPLRGGTNSYHHPERLLDG